MDIENISQQMLTQIGELGAKNIEYYNTESACNYAKRIIIATAKDNLSAKDIALTIKEKFKSECECYHTDGLYKGEWIILDFRDILVHIFIKETRQKFNIDKLWLSCKTN